MKISGLQILLALTLANISFAIDSKAQELLNRRVSFSVQNQDAEVLIKRLEKLANVQFLFSREIVQSKRKITYQANNEALFEVLDHVLTPLSLTYEVVGQQILIKRTPPKSQFSRQTPLEEASASEVKQIDISGRITSEDGQGLPGVNVQVKGTGRGTSTDVNGNYKLTLPDANGVVLVFSYVGYVTKEVAVGAQIIIDIRLFSDIFSP